VKQVRVVIEFMEPGEATASMRWERIAAKDCCGAFELLGRAFEVAQREEGTGFTESLLAFLRGAMVRKGDMADILPRME